MKVFVTGYKGRIGSLLVERGCQPLICDVTKYEEVEMAIRHASPDVVVHLASISNVDYCEKNKDEALRVNFIGTKFVADATSKQRCGMIFLSSDQVFGGKSGPYKEVRFARTLFGYDIPVNFYGEIKLASESLQLTYPNMKIIRTSYLFDEKRLNLPYLTPVLNVLGDKTQMEYPTFIYRSFMYVHHFIESLEKYIERFWEMPELLNISGSETISSFEFMSKAFEIFGMDKERIYPRKHESKLFTTPRPKKGGLDVGLSKKLGFDLYSYIDG